MPMKRLLLYFELNNRIHLVVSQPVSLQSSKKNDGIDGAGVASCSINILHVFLAIITNTSNFGGSTF